MMTRRTKSGLLLTSVLLGFWGIAQAGSFFKVGEPAPNFMLTALDGQTVSIEQFKGKVVVLGLFHICKPCLEQGTNLQKVYEATQDKPVAVIGVNSSGDSQSDVSEFLKTFPVKVTYPYLLDPNKPQTNCMGVGNSFPMCT